MTPVQREHIDLIRRTTGGLKPEDVLDDARNPNSPLHDCFTWDDTVAAEAYRLTQAKAVIRVAVRYLERPAPQTQRARINFEETKSAVPANEQDPTAELFSLTLREAEITVLIHSLRLEQEHIVRTMTAESETTRQFATERHAISLFIRGIPIADIVEISNSSAQEDVTYTEMDIARWVRQFGGSRPLRWSAELAREQWDSDEGGDPNAVFGIPPFGQRHPRYPNRKVGT